MPIGRHGISIALNFVMLTYDAFVLEFTAPHIHADNVQSVKMINDDERRIKRNTMFLRNQLKKESQDHFYALHP